MVKTKTVKNPAAKDTHTATGAAGTKEDIKLAWLTAKRINPLLDRRDFALAQGVSERKLARYLVDSGDREILSNHIADMIRDCATELDVEPSDLRWSEFASHYKLLRGVHPNSASGLKQHHMSQVGGFATVRDAHFPKKITDRSVESQRIADHAAVNRRLGAAATRETFARESVERMAERVFSGKVQAPRKPPKLVAQKRVVTAVWSDLHFGSDIASQETGLVDFGRVEEARSFAKIVEGIAEYKPAYRAETTLRILSLGDIIEGKLHDRQDGAALAEQVCRAIHLKVQAIAYLSQLYPHIDVHCVSGNHDRMKERHNQRATSHKADSYGTMINYAVKTACSMLPNVKFFIPDTSYIISEVLGHKTFATHGDGTFNPGNPGKVISVGNLEGQINRISADLRQHHRDNGQAVEDCTVWVCGHIHTGMQIRLPNGATLLTNGGLPPTNGFGINGMGRFNANRGQWIFESTSDYAFGDARFLNVTSRDHFNAELDQIIKPFGGVQQ